MSMDTDSDCDSDPFLFFVEMKKRQRVAGCLRASAQDANNNGVETLEYSSNKPFLHCRPLEFHSSPH